MASRLRVRNMSRVYDYTLVLDGRELLALPSLQEAELPLAPGDHEISFRAGQVDDLPSTCKPIFVTIDDGRELPLQVDTRHFAICIADENGIQLNGKHGFIAGRVANGVYINNPIG